MTEKAGKVELRHAMLPLEKPCTENLTPFISLLPCRSHAGLGQLLKPNHLFDSDWQKLSISVIKIGEDRMELSLELEMVSNPVRLDLAKSGSGRRGWRLLSTNLFEFRHSVVTVNRLVVDLYLWK